MSHPYLVSALPDHQVAELHRLMSEEIEEVAVFFTDTKGTITVWNRAAEVMKGYTAEEAIGRPLSLLYTDSDNARDWSQHNLDWARQHGCYREEAWRQRKDGTLFWARIALTALRDARGRLVGFSKITMDLTEHKRLEQCVDERDQMRRILRAARAGTWTWLPEGDRVEVDTHFLEMLGRPAGSAGMTLGDWLGFVDPRDRPALQQRLAALRTMPGGAPLATETRLVHADGSVRWFYLHADWDGAPAVLSGVNVDIQAHKSTGEELQQAMQKLREADARKDEFLAMLAHELRNPLAPIRSAAELLRMARLDEERVRRTSEIIARQVTHMTSLVNDLLDVSRLTRGLVTLEQERLEVTHIVNEATEQVFPLLRARRHELTLALRSEGAAVRGDRKRLVQVMTNLLTNAAKYTPEGGHVEIHTETAGGEVALSVKDDGIGMTPALAKRVFEPFAQAERTPDRSSGGLGLGLALVRSLVQLHGGSVHCASPGLGQGSRFTVRLPLAAPDATPPVAEPLATAPDAAAGLRVMVVDDNADAAQMLALLLETWGHEVRVEHGSRQALARARAEPPDVFLLDIGLPGMDGNELARQLRAHPETAGAALIAVTGYGQAHDRHRSLAAGFSRHLVKPVDPAELLALLADIGRDRRRAVPAVARPSGAESSP